VTPFYAFNQRGWRARVASVLSAGTFILMDRNDLLLQRRTKPLVLRGIEWEALGHLDADRGEFPPDLAEPAPVVATVGYPPR
jgi:hypothetical protein